MKKTSLAFIFTFLFLGQHAFATGLTMKTTCTPLLEGEGDPVIVFYTTTFSAPGGPISRSVSVMIDGSTALNEISDGVFEHDLKIQSIPVQTPSGALSSFFRFITLEPGHTHFKATFEALYRCEGRVGR